MGCWPAICAGGSPFLAVVVVLRLAFPRGRALLASLLYGLFNFAGSFGLIYYGLVQVHAGLGQILLALVPLAPVARGALAAGAPPCRGGRGNPSRSRGRRGDFSFSPCRRTCPCCRCSPSLAARSASPKPWCSFDASHACTR